jgi:hypothetical protein
MQQHRSMSQGLAWDRAPVSAAAADFVIPLDDRDRLVILRSHHGCPLSGRSAANHKHIKIHFVASQISQGNRSC